MTKNVQIDLITTENQCIFSRRAIKNTLIKTIEAARERYINLEKLNMEKTINVNNRHLRNKIQNFLVIHSNITAASEILNNLKSIGHWGEKFQTSYASLIHFLKNPHAWTAIIMDGDQSSDYSLKLITKLQLYKPQAKLIVLSDNKKVHTQYNHLNISYAPKNFDPLKHLAPVF